MNDGERRACFCCGGERDDGILIAGLFLCRDCEKLFVEAQPGSEGYGDLVERCKAIWAAQKI